MLLNSSQTCSSVQLGVLHTETVRISQRLTDITRDKSLAESSSLCIRAKLLHG